MSGDRDKIANTRKV